MVEKTMTIQISENNLQIDDAPYQPGVIESRREHPFSKALIVTSSYPTSIRKMKALLSSPPLIKTESPTQRFIDKHSITWINNVLYKYGMTSKDLTLFKKIMANETQGFLGYQAGSSTVRLFQDFIHTIVKDVLKIPIKDDFVFYRVPSDPTFQYESASDFLSAKSHTFSKDWDARPDIRQHILSLNMNLYQSYDAPWDLTPRYYLENQTWTYANVLQIIKPFFNALGIDSDSVDQIWSQGLDLLSHDRGYIMQFFDNSKNYEFTKTHSYIAYSGGKPNPSYKNHEILFDQDAYNFPQMRLVMDNKSTLNPFSSLSIKRYDSMTDQERKKYELSLRSLIEKLSFDPTKVQEMREKLLDLWIPACSS